MNQAKLSIVFNSKIFISKILTIPDELHTNDYVNGVVRKLHDSHDDINIILIETDESCFYYNGYTINGWYSSAYINQIHTSPKFMSYARTDSVLKFDGFKEIDLLLKHSELYDILPIISEEKAIQFCNFLINTLNINFHPDDDFSDYLRDGQLLDNDGVVIDFDSISIDFMTNQIENCLAVCGDEFYNYGTEILLKRSGIVTDEDTIEPSEIIGEMVHFCIGNDNEPYYVKIKSCEETGTGDKGKYYRLEWGTEDYLGIYGVDLQKVLNGYQASYENEYDVNITISLNELIANISDDFYVPYFNKLDSDFTYETEIGKISIPSEKLKTLFDRAIKPLTIDEDTHEGDDEYAEIYNIVNGFVLSLFPKLADKESLSFICYAIVAAMIENQREYQKHRPFVAPEELKTIFTGLLSAYYYLTNTWDNSDVDLNEGYPFSESFDEFSMSEWVESVCGEKLETYEDQASIDVLIESFGSYFEQLWDWIDTFQNHASVEEFDNFNQVFQTNYPFDTSFDDLVPYVREWVNGVKERYENQFKSEPVVEEITVNVSTSKGKIFEEIKYMVNESSYFTFDEQSDEELIFSTRENGDSGSEEYGEEDMIEGRKIVKLLKQSFPKEITISLEDVDEWVILTVTIK